MSTVIISIIASVLVCILFGSLHKGWVKAELDILHNRVNAANSEAQMLIKGVKDKANNAQAIASNALSSAQRAESKIVKHVEVTNG